MIVEDHAIVRDGLSSLLSYNGFDVVAAVSSGEDALVEFKRLKPGVVLMDLRLPGMGGVETTQAIKAEAPEAKIIVLTTYSGDEDLHRALRAGAKGYLLKGASTEELITAIETVLSGEMAVPAMVANRLVERSAYVNLTPRELEILQWIAKGKSNKEIGQILVITEGTIKTHVNSLLEKLNVSDRTEAVITGLRRGLIHMD